MNNNKNLMKINQLSNEEYQLNTKQTNKLINNQSKAHCFQLLSE